MKDRATTYLSFVLVAALAGTYFLLTYNRTLNPIDEGLMLNNFLRVSNGLIPHRDFYDDYGPVLYWLGGGLFKAFGPKIIVNRVFLLILRVFMTLLVFLIARKLLSTFFAFVSAALFVLNWGDPYFTPMNILYAGHLSHFMALVGILLMMLYVEKDHKGYLVAIGLCVGISMLCKFHSEVFHFIGFCVFLSLKELSRVPSSNRPDLHGESPGCPSKQPIQDESNSHSIPSPHLIRWMRRGKLVGLTSLCAFYLWLFARDNLDVPYFVIFLLPFFMLLGQIFLAEQALLRSSPDEPNSRSGLRKCYGEIILLSIGPVVLLMIVALYYTAIGGFGELIYDTFVLPASMAFYMPMKDSGLYAILAVSISALVMALIGLGRWLLSAGRDGGPADKAGMWAFTAIILLLALMPLVLLRMLGVFLETLQTRIIYALPATTLLLTSFLFIAQWRKERLAGAPSRETMFWGLLFIFACQGLVMAFPRTDATHIQVNSTVIFILVAYLLRKLHTGLASLVPSGGRLVGAVPVVACLAVFGSAFTSGMKPFFFTALLRGSDSKHDNEYVRLDTDFQRADGLDVPMWSPRHLARVWGDVINVSRYVKDHSGSGDTIFLLVEPQIVYFLSERKSILPKENYFVHIAAMGLIERPGDTRLTDEELLERLIDAKPRFIVSSSGGRSTIRITSFWANTARYIDNNYEKVKSFGVYEVLRPRTPHTVGSPQR
jgi:hypothetical protein